MDGQDGMADPGTAAGSGARARRSEGTRPAAATGPSAACRADDGVRRHYHGAMAYLKDLAAELDSRGLAARVIRTGTGVAFVRVVNPLATTMRENVTCAPSPVGLHDWYYWWSWGECMHRVDDPAGAASKVAHVLDAAAAPTG
ncbi:MAG TPA: hypothetical protein VLW50_28640 [Streptosporangiaceae bacterium]|nr:hypothetical protein [Streptosporangiaceae bacterium]